MFERFTDRARRVVVLAQEEARVLNHNYIGTEHILLGMLHEGEGVAARVLTARGVATEQVRTLVQEIIGTGTELPTGHIPFTPRAKKVLELSLREALQLAHNYIGTEHILLGMIREGEGVAVQILTDRCGLDLGELRTQVLQAMSGAGSIMHRPREVGTPRCPGCSLDLEGRLGTAAMSATRDGEGGLDALVVVYCRGCGRYLDSFPVAEPVQRPEG